MTDFGTATLDIEWPKETENGKWLLYLMKISSTGVDHMECSPKEEINPRNKVSENMTFGCGGHSACTYAVFFKKQFRYVVEEDRFIFI